MSSKKFKSYSKETQQNMEGNNLIYGKVPPQARELEEAVLGALMLEKGALDEIANILQTDSFYVDAHRHIYKAIVSLSKKCQGVDILTVVEELKYMDLLEIVGGPYYVTKLTNNVVSSANIKQHANIIQEKYLLREQIRIYSEGICDCYEASADGFDVLDKVNGQITTLAMHGVKNDARSVGDLSIERVIRLEHLRNQDHGLTGVPSDFEDIDIITGGWQDTDLIIVAARPSVGKTAFALQCGRNASRHKQKRTPCLFFSLEMSNGQLTDRILSCESGIELDYITKAKANDSQMKQLYEKGVQRLAEYPLFIDDTPALNIVELRAKCRKWKNKENIGLIIIDYLQLMSALESKGQVRNREQEVSHISRSLKALAKELKVPIIALSQLNREAEKGEPTLATLRESGAIEQDADIVIFLYREDYQKMESEIDPMLKGLSWVKFAKHRNGALEKVPMHTDLSIQKWFTPREWETYQRNLSMPNYGNLKKVADIQEGPKLYIMPSTKQTGTDDDTPF